MDETVLLTILGLLLCARWGESVRCFECKNSPTPISCGDITTCAVSESCFLEQLVTTSGNVVYNSGCESNMRCGAQSGRRAITKRNSDIVTCRECCTGHHCNNRGCGIPEVDRTQRGVYCYTCPSLTDPAACETVSICLSTEKCLTHIRPEFLGLQAETIYASECESEQACRALEALGSGKCCDEDFCNDNYNQSIVTIPTTLAHTDTTTYAATNAPTTADTTTYAATKAPTTVPTQIPTKPSTHVPVHHCDNSGGYERHTLSDGQDICVRVHNEETLAWEDAKTACESDNARLIVTTTAEKQDMLKDIARRHGARNNYWIGLRDRDNHNKYIWLNGERVGEADWGRNQPDNNFHNHPENCVLLYRYEDYKMHDSNCNSHNNYICERL